MTESTSISKSHLLCSGYSLRLNIGLNASRGLRPATRHRKTEHPQRKGQALQDKESQSAKELRLQNWAKRCDRLDELSDLNPENLKALKIKECLLEVQAQLLGRLAAEENDMKGLLETIEPSKIDFDKRVKEVEEAIQVIRY